MPGVPARPAARCSCPHPCASARCVRVPPVGSGLVSARSRSTVPRPEPPRTGAGRRGLRRHQQRARRLLPHRRRRASARSTATATTWSASASPAAAAGWWSTTETIAGLQVSDGRLPELSEDAADAVLLTRGAGSSWRSARRRRRRGRPASALSALGPVDVAFALLHGPVRRGRHDPGAVRDDGHPLRRGRRAGQRGRDGQALHEAGAGRLRPAGRAVRGDHPRASGSATRPPAWRRWRRCTTRSSSSPPAAARASASPGWTRPRSSRRAIEVAQRFDPKVIVEEGFVGARELECGVLGRLDGGRPEASEVAEIRVHSASGLLRLRGQVPARGAGRPRRARRRRRRRRRRRCERLAVRTFEAIGCEGLARVDVFVTRDRRVVVNEINTMPGLHRALDVPPDVGGQRAGLPGAGRPADQLGPAASGRAALSAQLQG